MLKIYTDGGSVNPGRSLSGFVAVKDGEKIWERVHEELESTSIRSELYAVVMALRWASEQDEDCIIYTDSQYCFFGVTEWVYTWKKNDWKKVNGDEPKHLDLWKKVDKVKKAAKIKWIRGHDGNEWNEYIDEKVTVRKKRKKK